MHEPAALLIFSGQHISPDQVEGMWVSSFGAQAGFVVGVEPQIPATRFSA